MADLMGRHAASKPGPAGCCPKTPPEAATSDRTSASPVEKDNVARRREARGAGLKVAPQGGPSAGPEGDKALL